MYFTNVYTDNGANHDLTASTLEALAAKLPASWRGTVKALDEQGVVVGYIGRDLFTGVAHWKSACLITA